MQEKLADLAIEQYILVMANQYLISDGQNRFLHKNKKERLTDSEKDLSMRIREIRHEKIISKGGRPAAWRRL